jgi:hypothetical protein
LKPHFPILFLFFSFLGTTEGWCGVAPRESLTVCRAGGGLWAEGSYRLDFFGSFCVKTKRTRENVDLSWSPKSTNRYLREGKEYISDFEWNKYDFTGRTLFPARYRLHAVCRCVERALHVLTTLLHHTKSAYNKKLQALFLYL